MFSIDELLLLLISYQRKTNHPGETDIEIQAGVMADIAKIKRAMAAFENAASNDSDELKAVRTKQAETHAALLET